jgi:hypothetical protein
VKPGKRCDHYGELLNAASKKFCSDRCRFAARRAREAKDRIASTLSVGAYRARGLTLVTNCEINI